MATLAPPDSDFKLMKERRFEPASQSSEQLWRARCRNCAWETEPRAGNEGHMYLFGRAQLHADHVGHELQMYCTVELAGGVVRPQWVRR